MSAIAWMADVIARPSAPRAAAAAESMPIGGPRGTSSAGRMRQLLRERGPLSSRQLADEIGIPSTLVRPLFKHDLAAGRVRCTKTMAYGDGFAHHLLVWELTTEAEEGLHRSLREAVQLLRRHGYEVKAPEGRNV